MPRLFVDDTPVVEGRIEISGAGARHLAASLRIRVGDELTVVDPSGIEHSLRVESASPELVVASVVSSRQASGEPQLHIEVVQALSKDGMDDAIDAMVQAGVSVIRPVVTQRTVVRPDESKVERRTERWRSIARETAQLAFRARIPNVEPIAKLAEALEALPQSTRILAAVISPDARALSSITVENGRPVALCIGPEGGFGDNDMRVLGLVGAELVHLGPRIFRTRIAGAMAATILLANSGDISGVQQLHLDGEA